MIIFRVNSFLLQQKLTRKGKLCRRSRNCSFWYSVPATRFFFFFSLVWWFLKTAALKAAEQHRELPRLWAQDLCCAAALWLLARHTEPGELCRGERLMVKLRLKSARCGCCAWFLKYAMTLLKIGRWTRPANCGVETFTCYKQLPWVSVRISVFTIHFYSLAIFCGDFM